MASTDVVIVGGGVIGLSLAWSLARRGTSVTVLDAGYQGQASYAAAGMLAPLAETRAPGPLLELGLASLRAYPNFLAWLREEAGSDLALCGLGMLRVALSEEEEEALCHAYSWQKTLGLPLTWMATAELRELEPGVSRGVRAAVYSPREQHVNPRHLLDALGRACLRHHVRILPGVIVLGLADSKARVTAIQTSAGDLPCAAVVVTGGAWSGNLGEALGASLPVTPVRGQVLSLTQTSTHGLCHTVYSHRGYLVPRAGGQVVVGATEERVGFDTRTTAVGVASLLDTALSLVPALADASLESVWTGLRPVSADGLPLLGQVPGWTNVHAATGHGRNGILLTPITAELMTQHLLNGAPPPASFDPVRLMTTP